MKKIKRIILLTPGLACLLLSGCMRVEDAESKSAPPPYVEATSQPETVQVKPLEEQVAGVSEPRFRASVSPLPELHRYQVTMALPTSSGVVRRTISGRAEYPDLHRDGLIAIDESVPEGSMATYEWGTVESTGFVPQESVNVRIPRDYRFEDVNGALGPELQSLDGGRLVLKRSQLWLDASNLRWRFENIHSEKSVLGSFPPGAQAPEGRDGRSGGNIEIRARSATGQLEFQLRGERGGRGSRGANGVGGKSGSNGTAVITAPHSWEQVQPYFCHDVRAPEAGGRGGDGKEGLPGGRGGHSASLNLQLLEAEHGFSKVIVEPGFGGEGGPGGFGGSGGIGGVNKQLKSLRSNVYNKVDAKCGESEAPNGSPGQPGTRGPSGAPGVRQMICEQIGDKRNCF